MIKNKTQLDVSKRKLDDLLFDKNEFLNQNKEIKGSPYYNLTLDSFNSIIKDLEKEINEYENISNGNLRILEAETFDNIHKLLIGARIAQKLTQKELADRVGLQPQQIQRYESSDYESADLTRIKEILYALKVDCKFEKIICMFPSSTDECFDLPNDITNREIEDYAKKISRQEAFIF